MTARNIEEMQSARLWAVIDRPYIGDRIHSHLHRQLLQWEKDLQSPLV